MTHQIVVLKSEISSQTSANGKPYTICELGYKMDDGKVKGMRIFSFNKPIYTVASQAKVDDILDATFKQNDKGYWEFASLKPITKSEVKSAVAAGSTSTSSRGNWETAEERQARQHYIVRQSSLSNALVYFELLKGKPSVEDVFKVATQMEAFVFGQSSGDVSDVE